MQVTCDIASCRGVFTTVLFTRHTSLTSASILLPASVIAAHADVTSSLREEGIPWDLGMRTYLSHCGNTFVGPYWQWVVC